MKGKPSPKPQSIPGQMKLKSYLGLTKMDRSSLFQNSGTIKTIRRQSSSTLCNDTSEFTQKTIEAENELHDNDATQLSANETNIRLDGYNWSFRGKGDIFSEY